MEEQNLDNQPPQAPVAKGHSLSHTIIFILVVIFVGVFAYLFGVSQGKSQMNQLVLINKDNITPTGGPINTAMLPTASTKDVNWKQESNTIAVSSERIGNAQYNFTFSYPDTWDMQKITATYASETYEKNCADYTMTNPATNASVVIQMVCGGWSAIYYPYPSNAEIVQKLDKQGNDGHTTYWIRYFSSEGNMYSYYDASVSQGENLTSNTKVMDVALISYAPDDWFFIPVKFWLSAPAGTKINDTDISSADAIIKSLKLTRE